MLSYSRPRCSFQPTISMSRPIYPALVGEVARLGRSKTGDNQQRDDQRHEAGSSHEGTSRLMIEITCWRSPAQEPVSPHPALSFMSALPTPARFRPLGPPMFDSPTIAS